MSEGSERNFHGSYVTQGGWGVGQNERNITSMEFIVPRAGDGWLPTLGSPFCNNFSLYFLTFFFP